MPSDLLGIGHLAGHRASLACPRREASFDRVTSAASKAVKSVDETDDGGFDLRKLKNNLRQS